MREKTIYDPNCKNIRELVYSAAKRYPENLAFKYKDSIKSPVKDVTFTQMIENLEALGTQLMIEGFSGGPIGIIGANSYPWYNCFLAAVCGGSIAVPMDAGFTAEELESSIMRSEIRILFYGDKHEKLVEEVKSRGNISTVEKFVRITGENNPYEEMIVAGKKAMEEGNLEYRNAVIDEKALAVLLFTSGTTSTSKAVMLSQYNIVSNCIDMYEYELFYSTDVNMAFLPFHHSFGLVGCMVFLCVGACSVFCDGLKYVSKNLQDYRVTVFVGVPLLVENMYKKIIKEVEKKGMVKKVNLGRKICAVLDKFGIHKRRQIFAEIINQLGGGLRLIICGAAPLAGDVVQGLNDFGILTIQGYGLTETSPVLCAESHIYQKAGSVGKPMPRVELVIDNPDDDGIGEIVVKGPNVMLGYLNQPEETAAVLSEDGWFRTGDLGMVDKDGYVWIRGRSKNVIVMKNGKNIFPEEIEAHIDQLPYVEESMVFTTEKHNEFVLWAKMVYSESYLKDNKMTEEELRAQAGRDIEAINSIMPQFKQVKHFIITTEPMIKTTTQKVKRNLEIAKTMKELEEKGWA